MSSLEKLIQLMDVLNVCAGEKKHEMPAGVKFCPECGKPRAEHTEVTASDKGVLAFLALQELLPYLPKSVVERAIKAADTAAGEEKKARTRWVGTWVSSVLTRVKAWGDEPMPAPKPAAVSRPAATKRARAK